MPPKRSRASEGRRSNGGKRSSAPEKRRRVDADLAREAVVAEMFVAMDVQDLVDTGEQWELPKGAEGLYVEGEVALTYPCNKSTAMASLALQVPLTPGSDSNKKSLRVRICSPHFAAISNTYSLGDTLRFDLRGASVVERCSRGESSTHVPIELTYGAEHGVLFAVQRKGEMTWAKHDFRTATAEEHIEGEPEWFVTPPEAAAPPREEDAAAPRTESQQATVRQKRKAREREKKLAKKLKNKGKREDEPTSAQPPGKEQPAAKKKKPVTAEEGRRAKEIVEEEKQREAAQKAQEIKKITAGLVTEDFNYATVDSILFGDAHGYHANFIAVVVQVGEIKKSTAGDQSCTLRIYDPSHRDPIRGMQVICFASKASELPPAKVGQVVLFRHVFIQRFDKKRQGCGRKNDYTWMLYDPNSRQILPSPGCTPPPNKEEAAYFEKLRAWHAALCAPPDPNDDRHVQIKMPTGKMGRSLARIEELEYRIFYDLIVEVRHVCVSDDRAELFVTDYTSNGNLPLSSHGMDGQRVMKVALWDDHVAAAHSLKEGHFVKLTNVRTKIDETGYMECSMGKDYGRINVRRLKTSDEGLKDLLERRKKFMDEEAPAADAEPGSSASAAVDALSSPSASARSPAAAQPAPLPPLLVTTLSNPFYEPTTSIADVLAHSKGGDQFRLRARVIDCLPHAWEQFVQSRCTLCGRRLKPTEKICLGCDDEFGENLEHVYYFALLLEDESAATLPIIVTGPGAAKLLPDLPPEGFFGDDNERLPDRVLELQRRLQSLTGEELEKHHIAMREKRPSQWPKGPWFDCLVVCHQAEGGGVDEGADGGEGQKVYLMFGTQLLDSGGEGAKAGS